MRFFTLFLFFQLVDMFFIPSVCISQFQDLFLFVLKIVFLLFASFGLHLSGFKHLYLGLTKDVSGRSWCSM